MSEVHVMVEGGKATAGAPLGPALGPLGVNIPQIVAQINEKTKGFAGMKVPVTVSVDSKKNVEVTIGSPPTSALIMKEAGITKAAANPKTTIVGNISLKQAIIVAESKIEDLNSSKLKSAVKEVIGTCKSMGVTVDGKDPRAVLREIEEGKHESAFK